MYEFMYVQYIRMCTKRYVLLSILQMFVNVLYVCTVCMYLKVHVRIYICTVCMYVYMYVCACSVGVFFPRWRLAKESRLPFQEHLSDSCKHSPGEPMHTAEDSPPMYACMYVCMYVCIL